MTGKLLKFGLFELNTATRQLHKQGRRIRIQEQPLRMLELLLEQPGRLVSRQEMRQRLWPNHVHVDFELGLTGAAKRLRLALGDPADNPRFIETVPKAGYRFLAPVQVISLGESHSTVTAVSSASTAAAAVQPIREVDPAIVVRRRTFTARWLIPLFLAGAIATYLLRPLSPALYISRVVKITSTGSVWPYENLLSDGSRVYYTAYTVENGFQLHEILWNGKEDTLVGDIGDQYLVRALSPDHTTFLAISHGAAANDVPSPLWTFPVTGGPPRRLGTLRTNDFGWSPDGRMLAFGKDTQLCVAELDGSRERVLANAPGRVIQPRWSPDGHTLRFTVLGEQTGMAIWEVRDDGRNLHPLLFPWPGTPMEGYGEWTADGRYYVFVSLRNGTSDVWALEEITDRLHRRQTEPVQLTAGPISYVRPLPAVDGSRLFAIGTQLKGELQRYDAARHGFVPFLAGRSAEHLDFRHDQQAVVYVAYPEGTLWRARADGSAAVQLTSAPLRVSRPRWSPDGRRILFVARQPGALPQIFSIAAEGGNPEPLFREGHAQDDPTWSPDGLSVLYGRDPNGENQDIALYRFDLRTGRAERLLGTDGLYAPLWSPDGRYIVAQSAGSERSLVLLELSTGRHTTLVKNTAEYPVWSVDSRLVYFSRSIGDRVVVARIKVDGGTEERVADVPFKLTGSYGVWTGLTPDGSPLVLRDRGQTDVYAMTLSRR